jgi:FAD/FMN-containing dehydrogenase
VKVRTSSAATSANRSTPSPYPISTDEDLAETVAAVEVKWETRTSRQGEPPEMTIEAQAQWNSSAVDFNGHMIRPQSPENDKGREIWDAEFDRRPFVVLRLATVEDVARAVRFARETDLPTAVRSGGHSYRGHSSCADGNVMDLSLLWSVEVDPVRGVVRLSAGSLLRDLDQATIGYGQVFPAGIVSHTGVASLALGGGIGYLTRAFGLTCDQFIRLEVVTADGEIVYASADENRTCSGLFEAAVGTSASSLSLRFGRTLSASFAPGIISTGWTKPGR